MEEDLTTDAEWLERFRQSGDETAFARIVERYQCLVFGIALRRTGDRGLAEDVVQQVFTILAKKASRVRTRPTLAPWLVRATLFEASKTKRKEVTRKNYMKAYERM
ncbi:MAG: sigma factor, partial [Verrucomicrobiota bacterium]